MTDLSLKDWDEKEQESLREVEKILDRADEILEVSDCTILSKGVWRIYLDVFCR